MGTIRYCLPNTVRVVLASATLPGNVLDDACRVLKMRKETTSFFRRSNDRPNINLCVRRIKYPLSSFKDLLFLVPDFEGDSISAPKKFLVFFDSITEAVDAAHTLRDRLPVELHKKIPWLHSEMSPAFRTETTQKLADGEIWGLCCTDSFGMV